MLAAGGSNVCLRVRVEDSLDEFAGECADDARHRSQKQRFRHADRAGERRLPDPIGRPRHDGEDDRARGQGDVVGDGDTLDAGVDEQHRHRADPEGKKRAAGHERDRVPRHV